MASQYLAKHVVIACHPDIDSFTMSVAECYAKAVRAAGDEVVMRDLYRMNFDPVLKADERRAEPPFTPAHDIATELDLLAGADVFVLIYPIWFGTPPALIKGYVDRVFGAGHASANGNAASSRHAFLHNKQLLSFTSSATTRQWMTDQGGWAALASMFDGYLAQAFWMASPQHVHFAGIVDHVEGSVIDAAFTRVREQAQLVRDMIANTKRKNAE